MSKISKIIKSKLGNDKKKLFEVSLARIWQHIENSNEKSFAILTSWRAGKSKKENIKDFNELKSAIRNSGLGFVVVKGHWRECQDPDASYEDCPEEELTNVTDPSLFVVGISKKLAQSLGAKFGQDAIVFAEPEVDGRVKLLFNDGTEMDLGEFKPQTIGQAYTELVKSKKGAPRYFKFEGIEYPTQTWIEKLIEQELSKIS